MLDPLPADKKILRPIMKHRLAETARQNPEAPNALRDLFMAGIGLSASAVIAGYVTQDHEIDPEPLLRALHAKRYNLALPCTAEKDGPLTFRAFKPGDLLVAGQFGIPEPSATARLMEPDVLLVPLLAFDSKGHRLGRGGGHYDRTLTALRKRRKIVAIGLGFAEQQLSAIPADSLDARLDKIVTEIEVIPILNPC